MPLFKVQDSKRTSRVTVCASTLAQLLAGSVRKLNLQKDILYQVHDDKDGSLVDEDECLLALAEFYSSRGEHLALCVLQVDESWTAANHTLPVLSTPERGSLRSSSSESDTDTVRSLSPETVPSTPTSTRTVCSNLPVLPYKDYVAKLQQALTSPQAVRHKAMTRSRRMVVKSITDKLKNKTIPPGAIKEVCAKVYSMCPDAFTVQIRESSESSCFPSFVRAVYNAIGYARDSEGIRARKQRRGGSSSDDPDDPQEVPHLCLDSNGCAEGMWEPALIDDDYQQLDAIRMSLLGYQHMPSADDDNKVMAMIRKSFPLQRRMINRALTAEQWREVFAAWPLLQRHTFFMAHADLLMGKDNHEVWHSSLSALHTLIDYFSTCLVSKQVLSNKERLMSEWIAKAKEASDSLSNREPLTIGAIPLLITYFAEKTSEFFLVINEQLTEEEVLSRSGQVTQCPLLVIKGSSIFDINAETAVVVRGQFLIKTRNFTHAVLVVILSYFIFNIAYPKEIKRTLEFLQRYILLVNPKEKGKVRLANINPAVATLSGLLADYVASTSRWTESEN